MAAPSVFTYALDSKVKWIFFVHNISSSFISFFVIDVTISFSSYILFKIISVVQFNGTFMNKDLMSNDTILCSSGNYEMKEMIILCTKNVYFTFESRTYVQTDVVAMGSPRGSVLAGTFTTELENSLLPNLKLYKIYKLLETICWWYNLFCKNRYRLIYNLCFK